MLKFVTTDGSNLGKRKHVLRACDRCRKRKRRCYHTSDPQASEHSQLQETPTREEQPQDSRFVGDMNPEGRLLAATSPQDLRSSSGNVGVWLTDRLSTSDSSQTLPRSSLFYSFAPSLQRVLVPLMETECLSCLPPAAAREKLCDVYFKKIHPLLPIVNRQAYQDLPVGKADRILLEQGMCLAASMDFTSRSHLKIGDDSNTSLEFHEFGSRTMAAMRVSVEMSLVTDKAILIQALSLMSLFDDSPEASEISSLMIGRAVQYVHSTGLHIREQHSETDNDHSGTLFCCIWALDRLNAALHGRPILMHERDNTRSLQQRFQRQDPAFRVFLHVVQLLDEVFTLYRPAYTGDGAIRDFPLFEEVVTKCEAFQIPTHLLATIEVLYHAVAVLSCRPEPGDANNSLPGSVKTRQTLSSERVTAMVGNECYKQLVLLPFVPYAVSLSLSVVYRDLRHSKIPMHRARSRKALEANCRILESLGEIFWSAAAMANMGNLTLKELDRVYSTVSDEARRKKQETQHTPDDLAAAAAATVVPIPPPHDDEPHVDGFLSPDTNLLYFSDMPEIDPFDMFDADFDLDGIDACLEGNLALSHPTNFFHVA